MYKNQELVSYYNIVLSIQLCEQIITQKIIIKKSIYFQIHNVVLKLKNRIGKTEQMEVSTLLLPPISRPNTLAVQSHTGLLLEPAKKTVSLSIILLLFLCYLMCDTVVNQNGLKLHCFQLDLSLIFQRFSKYKKYFRNKKSMSILNQMY